MHVQSCSRKGGRKENTWKNVGVNEEIILKWGLSNQTKKCEQDMWIGHFGSRHLNNVAPKFRVS
jgi:hypothetical protein